jgi:hypothetical protein
MPKTKTLVQELAKLRKIMSKLEAEYEEAEGQPVRQKRLLKRAEKVQKRLDFLG